MKLLIISFILTIFVQQMKIIRNKGDSGEGADEEEGVGIKQFFENKLFCIW